jgi:hypothetical protein
MGFLHLVFLGFVSLFILAYYSKIGLLDDSRLTKIALMVFAAAVILNEVLLIAQGLAIIYIPGSSLFPWLLWVAGISLFTGSILTAIARIKTKRLL